MLLFVTGFAGKVVEQAIASYGKAHHLALPNIEYVLWAIIFGLVIANTIGVPEPFRAGVDTYEFWLKTGIVLQGARFLIGDVLKLGGVEPRVRRDRTRASHRADDGAGPRVQAAAEAH